MLMLQVTVYIFLVLHVQVMTGFFFFPLNGWLETRFEETLEAHVALWAR